MPKPRNIEMTGAEHNSAWSILSSRGATVAETDTILASLSPNHTREELSQVLKGWFKTRPIWTYSQRATWDNADEPQSFANGQILDTVQEGVEDGALLITVLDGAVRVVNSKLDFTTQTTPAWNAQGGRYTNAVPRALGKALFATINMSVLGANGFMIGWSSSADVNWSGLKRRAYWISGTVTGLLFNITGSGTNPALVSPVLIDTDYELVIVLGGFDSDGNPYYSGQDPSLYLFGAHLFRKAAGVWMLDWVDHKEDSPVYPVWTNHSSAGTIKPFKVPTRDYRTVLIPSHFSSFNAVVGTSVDAITPEVGSPFVLDGLWDIQAAGATTQGADPGGAAFLAISEINTPDVFLRTWITPIAGETGGLVFRYFDDDNMLLAAVSPNNNNFKVFHRLLGTWGLIGPTVPMTINAGTEYVITVHMLGNRIIATVDDANTIDVLTVINPTFSKHGLRANRAGTSFKRFIGYPLASTAYYGLNDN